MKSKGTNIGKFLSLVLRHHPEMIGITLDRYGWADVDELVKGVQKKTSFSRQQLEELVRNDAKQRYSFNADHTKIRANQGHSISVDLEVEPLVPPDILWHGSARRFHSSIKKNGLLSGSRLYIHLSLDPETSQKVGARHGKPIIYQAMSGKMHQDGYIFYRSLNGVWPTKYVPVKYLCSYFEN